MSDTNVKNGILKTVGISSGVGGSAIVGVIIWVNQIIGDVQTDVTRLVERFEVPAHHEPINNGAVTRYRVDSVAQRLDKLEAKIDNIQTTLFELIIDKKNREDDGD